MEKQTFLLKPAVILAFLLAFTSRFACAGWTSWYDFDNGSGTGDYERIKDHPTAENWRPCGGRVIEKIQARILRMPGFKITTSDHLVVGPSYGLYCSNGVVSGKCQDYAVQYCTPFGICSNWKDVDDPGFVDNERLTEHGPVVQGPVEYLNIRVQNDPDVQYRVYQKIKLSPRYGLQCKTSDQDNGETCKDYQVRYYCGGYPSLGFRSNGP